MELSQAIDLIKEAFTASDAGSTWMDLGCGSGTFTKALSALTGKGCLVYAIDNSRSSLDKLPELINEVVIHKIVADFTVMTLPPGPVDGILMANSLHYVADKPALIQKLAASLKPDAAWLIVEYDTSSANQWVPYPVPFTGLQTLFREQGYKHIRKVGQMDSVYQRGGLYAALIKK